MPIFMACFEIQGLRSLICQAAVYMTAVAGVVVSSSRIACKQSYNNVLAEAQQVLPALHLKLVSWQLMCILLDISVLMHSQPGRLSCKAWVCLSGPSRWYRLAAGLIECVKVQWCNAAKGWHHVYSFPCVQNTCQRSSWTHVHLQTFGGTSCNVQRLAVFADPWCCCRHRHLEAFE